MNANIMATFIQAFPLFFFYTILSFFLSSSFNDCIDVV